MKTLQEFLGERVIGEAIMSTLASQQEHWATLAFMQLRATSKLFFPYAQAWKTWNADLKAKDFAVWTAVQRQHESLQRFVIVGHQDAYDQMVVDLKAVKDARHAFMLALNARVGDKRGTYIMKQRWPANLTEWPTIVEFLHAFSSEPASRVEQMDRERLRNVLYAQQHRLRETIEKAHPGLRNINFTGQHLLCQIEDVCTICCANGKTCKPVAAAGNFGFVFCQSKAMLPGSNLVKTNYVFANIECLSAECVHWKKGARPVQRGAGKKWESQLDLAEEMLTFSGVPTDFLSMQEVLQIPGSSMPAFPQANAPRTPKDSEMAGCAFGIPDMYLVNPKFPIVTPTLQEVLNITEREMKHIGHMVKRRRQWKREQEEKRLSALREHLLGELEEWFSFMNFVPVSSLADVKEHCPKLERRIIAHVEQRMANIKKCGEGVKAQYELASPLTMPGLNELFTILADMFDQLFTVAQRMKPAVMIKGYAFEWLSGSWDSDRADENNVTLHSEWRKALSLPMPNPIDYKSARRAVLAMVLFEMTDHRNFTYAVEAHGRPMLVLCWGQDNAKKWTTPTFAVSCSRARMERERQEALVILEFHKKKEVLPALPSPLVCSRATKATHGIVKADGRETLLSSFYQNAKELREVMEYRADVARALLKHSSTKCMGFRTIGLSHSEVIKIVDREDVMNLTIDSYRELLQQPGKRKRD